MLTGSRNYFYVVYYALNNYAAIFIPQHNYDVISLYTSMHVMIVILYL